MNNIYIAVSIISLTMMACQGDRLAHVAAPDELNMQEKYPWTLWDFKKLNDENPILVPEKEFTFTCPVRNEVVHWEERNVLNPTALVIKDQVHLIYRAQDEHGTSRLGLAISDDGIHFTKQAQPIVYPDNDEMSKYEMPGGVEDPRIVMSDDGRYILTYTAYDGKTARLMIASSVDLKIWKKHGPVLGTGKYKDTWSKSGAIVTRLVGDQFIATKVDGKYWMYFGDTDFFMAYSDDLINWEVAVDKEMDTMISVMSPRPGYFDSRLIEPGPAPFIIDEGILVLYNSRNSSSYEDTSLAKLDYAAGQALFDKERPYKLLDRTDRDFIHPEMPYEKVGEVNNVCFIEGLVPFKGKWFLYYGTADSKIAVAVRDM